MTLSATVREIAEHQSPPNEQGRGTSAAASERMMIFPHPPKFEDKHEERKYLKERLAAAFRIFGKYGFDEGVAGHITLRVSIFRFLYKPTNGFATINWSLPTIQ